MKTDEDRTSVEYDGGHNHQPDLNDVLVREVKTRVIAESSSQDSCKKASETGHQVPPHMFPRFTARRRRH
jgi:hypothetical protein